ncbi:MAG TPA: hypothetical protein VFE53_13665 [Mucilaginibacter sp.]|jgi:hypothetical protein|nr:hypothetical protein [Mucilaginibacter sp.]
MFDSIRNFNFRKVINAVDWPLLLFLTLFLDVKIVVKVLAILIIYLLRFDFRFKFSFKNTRIPLFYPLILGIAFIGLVPNLSFNKANYLPVFFMGVGFWVLCLLAVHQVKLAVERNDTEVIHRTVLVFFVINAIISLFNIGAIIIETHALNPYRYQGEYQKYFIQTGDFIRGITFDTSTTNAVINAFGVIYFLVKKNPLMVLVCMAVLLLTGSNFTNLVLLIVLILLFIFKTNRDQKSVIVVCTMLLVVFMAKITPQNNKYAFQTVKNMVDPPKPPDAADLTAHKIQTLNPDDVKRQVAQKYLDSIKALLNPGQPQQPVRFIPSVGNGRYIIPGPNINTPPYQTATDTDSQQRQLLAFIAAHKTQLPISSKDSFAYGLPGKGVAFFQTINFLRAHPVKILAGDGIGNFSSKAAFKAAGMGLAGSYPAKYVYMSNEFISNHFDVYLNYFSKQIELHSLTNSPSSVYDQLLAEYGLLGALAFCVYYLGFFARRHRHLGYGLPILLLMLGVFFIDYWFEQLSVIVFFELLLFLDIKEHQLKPATNEQR